MRTAREPLSVRAALGILIGLVVLSGGAIAAVLAWVPR